MSEAESSATKAWKGRIHMAIQVECSHCRHVNVVDARTRQDYPCQRCGSPLAICPHCYRPRAAEAVICIYCGLDFRTGKPVAASPESQQLGDFSLCPTAPGVWRLSMRRRLFGMPLDTRELHLAGFDKVYYDTVDSWTLNVAPTDSPEATKFSLSAMLSLLVQLLKLLAVFTCGLVPYLLLVRLTGNANSQLLFEVGFLGPQDRFLRVDAVATRRGSARLPPGFPRRWVCRSNGGTAAAPSKPS